jgi:DNA-binding protein HU-beta
MTKADIARDVSREAETTLVRAEHCVEFILEALKARLLQSGRIELRGFGVLVIQRRKRGVGRNPRTGEVLPIAPGRTVRFKPGKLLRGMPPAGQRKGLPRTTTAKAQAFRGGPSVVTG